MHKDILDKFGADPILTNKLEFTDMTVHEMQEDLWKRNNVLYTKFREQLIVKPIVGPPYVDWNCYF